MAGLQTAAVQLTLDLYLISDRQRFQQLLERSGGAVVVVDDRATLRYLSPTARPLFADLCNPALGQSMLSYVHRKDLYYVMRGLQALLSGGTARTSWLFRLLSPQGSWRWFKALAVRFTYGQDQQITAVFLHELAGPSLSSEPLHEAPRRLASTPEPENAPKAHGS